MPEIPYENNLNVPIVRRQVANVEDPKNDKAGDPLARVETFENLDLKERYNKLSGSRFQR